MAMQIYYSSNGVQEGPVTADELEALHASGIVDNETLVWHAQMPDWAAYAQVKSSLTGSASSSSDVNSQDARIRACAECGRTFPSEDTVQFGNITVCAECKPVYIQRLREGVAIDSTMQPGGFWIRFGAKIIDMLITGLINQGFSFLVGAKSNFGVGLNLLIGIALPLAYVVYFLGKHGATPGKMICGLKVVLANGQPISYGRACGRFFAEWLSSFTFGIGYIMAAFDAEKRTLHDRICNTRVIKK